MSETVYVPIASSRVHTHFRGRHKRSSHGQSSLARQVGSPRAIGRSPSAHLSQLEVPNRELVAPRMDCMFYGAMTDGTFIAGGCNQMV